MSASAVTTRPAAARRAASTTRAWSPPTSTGRPSPSTTSSVPSNPNCTRLLPHPSCPGGAVFHRSAERQLHQLRDASVGPERLVEVLAAGQTEHDLGCTGGLAGVQVTSELVEVAAERPPIGAGRVIEEHHVGADDETQRVRITPVLGCGLAEPAPEPFQRRRRD